MLLWMLKVALQRTTRTEKKKPKGESMTRPQFVSCEQYWRGVTKGDPGCEGFVGNDGESEVNVLDDGEPVEVIKDRGDVVMGMGEREKPCSRILYIL